MPIIPTVEPGRAKANAVAMAWAVPTHSSDASAPIPFVISMTASVAAVDRAVAEGASLDAGDRRSVLAVRARHVAVDEGRHHQVSPGDSRYLSAGFLDHPDELVANRPGRVGALAPVVPQVRPADAGQHHPNDGVGRLLDHRIRPLADRDVPRSAENGSSHSYLAFRIMS